LKFIVTFLSILVTAVRRTILSWADQPKPFLHKTIPVFKPGILELLMVVKYSLGRSCFYDFIMGVIMRIWVTPGEVCITVSPK
jgi:hypothetical protein